MLVGIAWVLALWSAGFGVLVSLQHNLLLRMNHPELYARLARTANHLPWWYDRLAGTQYGPVELRVVFPRDVQGQVEPLVVTGNEFLSDYLYVHYLAEGRLRFGFEHTSRGGGVGPAVKFDPGVGHVVLVQMGSLYPPPEYPAYVGLSPEERRSRFGTVQVYLDGEIVLTLKSECYDATGRLPSIGTSGPHRPGFQRDFSGRILGWRRVAPLPVDPPLKGYGVLRLTLQLPAFKGRTSDPLLCSGKTGKGDLIYLVRLDERHISIGHDRWGYGGGQSAPVEIIPENYLQVEISCPPLLPPGSPEMLRVKVDGAPVLEERGPFHPSQPDQVVVGANPIGSSMCSPAFTGEIVAVKKVSLP